MRLQLAHPWTARRTLLVAIGLAALTALVLYLAGTTHGAGTFRVPSAAKILISYDGACTGLTLNTAITETETITTTQRKPINVSGAISGCVGTVTDPGTVQIDSELFDYANVATYTTAGVLPTEPQLDFDLYVGPDNMGAGAGDFPLNSGACPALQCFIYVGGERMQYDTRTTNSFHITDRTTASATHPTDSYVRAEGKLVLTGRRQPTRNSGWNPTPPNPTLPPGATDAAAHTEGVSTLVGDPVTSLTCRGRFTQTVIAGGNDQVNLRYRCYTRLTPHGAWPDEDYTTPPYTTSPADPSTGPPLALTPFLYHGSANGTLNETTGVLTLNTEVFGLTCIPYVPGHLWVKITQVINLGKTDANDPGTFRIFAYENDQCAGTQLATLGNGSNATYDETDGPLPEVPDNDTDKDGCSDYRELSAVALMGGQRDPFNPFDYTDLNHDGAVSIPVDVLQVAQAYGTSARYVDFKDRGVKVPDGVDGMDDSANPLDANGPNSWNKTKPNGSIDVPGDVLGTAQQFGHACPHASHPVLAPFGAHPTTLTAPITSDVTPNFLITVATTAGYPASGQLLISSETFSYNQSNSGSCSGINVLTQFCVKARGSGTQTGHNAGTIVYQKP